MIGVWRDMHNLVTNISLSDNYLSAVGMIPTCSHMSSGSGPYVLSTPGSFCQGGSGLRSSARSSQLHTAVCSGSGMVLLYRWNETTPNFA